MSIICPNCQTNFIVSKEQIGIAGRKVKCSQCLHIWHLKLDFLDEKLKHYGCTASGTANGTEENTIINEQVDSNTKAQNLLYLAGQGANLPVLVPIKTASSSMMPILWFGVIILLILMIFNQKFNLSSFLTKQNNMIIIDDIHIKQDKKERVIKVSYKINNNSDHNIIVPLIGIRLLNKNHQTVKSYITNQKNTKLLPKQQIEITTNLDTVPASSELLNIMLGNNLDFILE
jgi:predicted Zn finger-like uncharacterized protein